MTSTRPMCPTCECASATTTIRRRSAYTLLFSQSFTQVTHAHIATTLSHKRGGCKAHIRLVAEPSSCDVSICSVKATQSVLLESSSGTHLLDNAWWQTAENVACFETGGAGEDRGIGTCPESGGRQCAQGGSSLGAMHNCRSAACTALQIWGQFAVMYCLPLNLHHF